MNQATHTATQSDGEHIEISLKGTPAVVQRLLAAMAGMLDPTPQSQQEAPAQVLMTRTQAGEFCHLHPDTLSNLVKAGKLTNHGTKGKMLLSRVELMTLHEEQED